MNNRFNIKFYKSIRDIIGLPIKLIFKPTINGIENIPNKPYILVGNHKSFWDIPFVALYIKDDIPIIIPGVNKIKVKGILIVKR